MCNFETNEEVQIGIKEVLNNSLRAVSFKGLSVSPFQLCAIYQCCVCGTIIDFYSQGTHRFNTSQDSEGQILISQFIGKLQKCFRECHVLLHWSMNYKQLIFRIHLHVCAHE